MKKPIITAILSVCAWATAFAQTSLNVVWDKPVSVSKSTATMQVVVNAKYRKGSNIYNGIYKAIDDLNAEYIRFAPWYPYPKLAVAELKAPDEKHTYWDFTLIDPIVNDFIRASKGQTVVMNFPTIPQWMFKTPKTVSYPENPDEVNFNYGGGNELRDTTMKEVVDYFVRVFSWYTKGGFIDEQGKYHKSGYNYKFPYWEILNEPELEHNWSPQQYTRLYDSIATALHKLSPEAKFIGMASCVYGSPMFYEYFLDPKNHQPGVPIDMISYHFYAGGSDKQPYEHYQFSYYDQTDKFITSVRFIENIRKRLNPDVKVALKELGTFLSEDIRKKHIPAGYWNLSSGVFAYRLSSLIK